MKSKIHEFQKKKFKTMSNKVLLLIAVVGASIFASCEGPEGAPGPQGPAGTNVEAEVFELRNVNFAFVDGQYQIYQTLNPQILLADNLLIYRLSGTLDASTPIWQPIPRTLFLNEGELDYDYDFSKEDFTIYAGGTYNLATTPTYINNQTFRIVIIPGYLSNKSATANAQLKTVDTDDYQAIIKAYGINDKNVKVLNQ